MTQYKQLITSSLQRFSVHCGSILHLKINILIIYIGSFPCTPLNRQRHDRNEKNPFFRIRKSGLLPPELLGLTRQSPLFRTQKSLVSRLTLILHDHPHLQLRVCPPSNWTTVIQLMPTSNPDRKGPSIPATRNAWRRIHSSSSSPSFHCPIKISNKCWYSKYNDIYFLPLPTCFCTDLRRSSRNGIPACSGALSSYCHR